MLSRRYIGILAVAVVVLTVGCLGVLGLEWGEESDDPEVSEPDAKALLEAALSAEQTATDVHGVVTVELDHERTVQTTMEVWERPPDQYRADVLQTNDPQLETDRVVSNGTTTWHYDDETKVATTADARIGPGVFDDPIEADFETVRERYTVSFERTTTVADRPVSVVELDADDEAAAVDSQTLWIDEEYGYPIQRTTTMSAFDGTSMTTTVRFDDITFDEGLDAERVTFEPPADATLVDFAGHGPTSYDDVESADTAVPFDLAEPTIAAPYDVEGVEVIESTGGVSTATVRYTATDEPPVTVRISDAEWEPPAHGESVELGSVDGTLVESSAVTHRSVSWTCENRGYELGGSLEADVLLEMATTIGCE